jgi:arylsulfatase A-like enzyme
MHRRWTLLAAALILAAHGPSLGAGEKGHPNIIIILADDLGYGELGCYGHPHFKTPHLDKMAAQGVRLTHFNTPMPFCAPTRASLLTGRYPLRNGMTNNPAPDGGPKTDTVALDVREIMLAQLLRRAGYATGMVGKWHLGHAQLDYYPTRRGFDDYLGVLYSNDMRPVQLVQGEKVVEYPLVQATLTDRYTQWALEFITRNKGRPFFLYFAHAMPHKPLACSERFYKKSGAGLYGDVLAELDDSVGRLLAKLQELGLDENTLVIFTSDNGPWYGGSSGGLRGMKGTTWEGGYRVPCIARWSGKLPAGRTSDALSITADLFPTALAAAGIEAPRDLILDGRDLLPLLRGKAASPHEVIFSHQGDRIASVRDSRWKLHLVPAKDRKDFKPGVKWIDPRGPDGVTILAPYEQAQPSDYPGLRSGDTTKALTLFDLANDPGEQRDVAAQHPEVVARLRKLHEQFVQDVAKSRR